MSDVEWIEPLSSGEMDCESLMNKEWPHINGNFPRTLLCMIPESMVSGNAYYNCGQMITIFSYH